MTDMPTIDRRAMLAGAAAGAVLLAPAAARAAAADTRSIRAAVEQGKAASVARIQAWIRHPGIALRTGRWTHPATSPWA